MQKEKASKKYSLAVSEESGKGVKKHWPEDSKGHKESNRKCHTAFSPDTQILEQLARHQKSIKGRSQVASVSCVQIIISSQN